MSRWDWLRRDTRAAAAMVMLCAGPLAGCGVGGEGTGLYAEGRVEGFGSVIVGGQAFDDGEARVEMVVDPRAPTEVPLSALRLGMVARLEAAGSHLRTIRLAPEVVAPVAGIDAARSRIVVAGQTVQFDAAPGDPTALEGLQSVAELKVGDVVAVHGARDAAGVLRASHITRASGAGVRVAGTLEPVDPATGRWRLHGLALDLAAAQRLPADAVLAAGARVAVFAAAGLGPDGTLRADVVAVDTPALIDRAPVLLAGPVGRFASAADFDVRGIRVRADNAEVSGGKLADLAAGRIVELHGTFMSGRLAVARLRLLPNDLSPTVQVAAPIGDFVDPGRFEVRQTPVDASAATLTGFSAGNLGNGVAVRVTGRLRGGTVQALRVEPLPAREGSAITVIGSVTTFDAAGGLLGVDGTSLQLQLQPSTRFGGTGAAALAPGVMVQARGLVRGGVLSVTDLRVGPDSGERTLGGLAGNVEADGSGGGAFDVSEIDLVWTPQTQFLGPTGSPADLVNGRLVQVRAVPDGAVLRATVVDARATQPGVVRLRGTVTQLVSPSEIRLDGQRVDVSAATFVPADLATGLAGAYVDVEGTMVDGVLRATKVSDP